MADHRTAAKDPATNQPRGNLTARITFVKIDPGPVYLFLGFASHHLPTDEITVHSSWRSDQPTPVSITGREWPIQGCAGNGDLQRPRRQSGQTAVHLRGAALGEPDRPSFRPHWRLEQQAASRRAEPTGLDSSSPTCVKVARWGHRSSSSG
jgi:hypothetical protein